MRRLIGALAIVACLAACRRGGEVFIPEMEGPFGGTYALRQLNDASLPLYFFPNWYPGRGSAPNVQSTTLLSGYLTVRVDGSFIWSTTVEEVAMKQGAYMPEWVTSTVRREAKGTWRYSAATGAVTLEGSDQLGPYVLEGATTSTGLTLTSTFTGRVNSTFVLEK